MLIVCIDDSHEMQSLISLKKKKNNSSYIALRKQAYSNILKILPSKNENFQIQILIFFIFLLET